MGKFLEIIKNLLTTIFFIFKAIYFKLSRMIFLLLQTTCKSWFLKVVIINIMIILLIFDEVRFFFTLKSSDKKNI